MSRYGFKGASKSRRYMHRTIVFWVSSTAAYGRLGKTRTGNPLCVRRGREGADVYNLPGKAAWTRMRRGEGPLTRTQLYQSRLGWIGSCAAQDAIDEWPRALSVSDRLCHGYRLIRHAKIYIFNLRLATSYRTRGSRPFSDSHFRTGENLRTDWGEQTPFWRDTVNVTSDLSFSS